MKVYQTQVIIIGSGAAGIGAALQLKKANISYVILEARNRIGGRIKTIKFNQVFIDEGACWIHAFSSKNPMYRHVEQLKIKESTASIKLFQNYYIDQQIKQQYLQQTLQQAKNISNELFLNSKRNAQNDQLDKSVFQSASKYVKQQIQTLQNPLKRCVWLMVQMQQRHQGTSINKLSAKNYDYKIDQGNNYLPEGGYGQLLAKIASSNNLKVEFEKVVTRIAYGANKVEVTCKDGSVYRAKKVVCSLPLGVLKSGKVHFEPQLPAAYLESISRLGVALMNKIIVAFEENFWGSMSWISVGCNERGRFSQIYNFSQKGKHILCCFITDDFARKVEPLPDEELLGEFVALLGRLFKKEGIKVTDYAITKWGLDEFSLGSYTSFHVGSSPDDSYRLRKPVGDTLWIVGEHCYAEYIGTAHGAFATGQWASKQIINNLKEYA